MDTKHKILFYLLIIGVGFLLYLSMCGKSPNDKLDQALKELDSAQKHLDSALLKIDSTRIVIDTMRSNFMTFQADMNNMRKSVEQLNYNSSKSEQLFTKSLKDLKTRNQKLLEQLKTHQDSLPEIKIIN